MTISYRNPIPSYLKCHDVIWVNVVYCTLYTLYTRISMRRNITVATIANDIAILAINLDPKVASKMFEKGIRDIHKAD